MRNIVIAGAIFLIAVVFAVEKRDASDHQRVVKSREVIIKSNEATVVEQPGVHVIPAHVIQGEPFKVVVTGTGSSTVMKIVAVFPSKVVGQLSPIEDGATIIAFGPTDLLEKVGTTTVEVQLADGKQLSAHFSVNARPRVEAPLGIPQKLGGNTPEAATKLVTSINNEADILRALPSAAERMWRDDFMYPVTDPVITDVYGYSRLTGAYSIPHKGTDFRAKEGTPVYAMNSGIVRLAQEFRAYGKTIVLDHGKGLQTLYLHLSRVDVKPGDFVKKGDQIGLSGSTGYAEGPHLHLSLKINGISIDPMKFLELVNSKIE
jgi:murein DD-endopeptidase MepM/ murein hydrolase activator NlpD